MIRSDFNRPAQLQKISSLEILDIAAIGKILLWQQTTKMLIMRLVCAGSYAPLLFLRQAFLMIWLI